MTSTTAKARNGLLLLIVGFASVSIAVPDVSEAKSAVQQSRDGRHMLVSKDVGPERWAISYDVQSHIVVGNVFFPSGGDAAFIWCEQLRTNGDSDPRSVQRTFACYGASACAAEPCTSAEWSFISEATLPGEFFLPPAGSVPIATATPAPIILPTATRTPTPTPTSVPDPLRDILGTWTFETTIISVFFDHYRLERVETVNGIRVIVGTDLDDGGGIIVGRVEDLTGDPFPYEFAMLDPGTTICDFFVFDRTGPDSVAGADVLTDVAAGRCSSFLTGRLNPMIGTRTARASSTVSTATHAHSDEVVRNREAVAVAEDAGAAGIAADPDTTSAAALMADQLMGYFEAVVR